MRKLVVLAALLVASNADAKLKSSLDGYKDLKFGASKEQVEALVGSMTCLDDDVVPSQVTCYRDAGFQLADVPVDYTLWFLDDKVIKVTLSLQFPKDFGSESRIATYFEVCRSLEKKYGPSDRKDEKGKTIGDITFGGATFVRNWFDRNGTTSMKIMMWGDKDRDVNVIVTYDLTKGTDEYMKRKSAAEKTKKAKDADNL